MNGKVAKTESKNYNLMISIFSEARCQGFSLGTPVSSPSSVNGSANKIKLK